MALVVQVDFAADRISTTRWDANFDENAGREFLSLSIGLRWIVRHGLLKDIGLEGERVEAIISAGHSFDNHLELIGRLAY